MVNDGTYRGNTRWPWPLTPIARREQLLNRLCELREDPHFADWCRLTSALGLGDLPLDQLVALHDGAAASIFPEIGEWGRASGTVPIAPVRGTDAADTVLVAGVVSDRRTRTNGGGLTAPDAGPFAPSVGQGGQAASAQQGGMSHADDRGR